MKTTKASFNTALVALTLITSLRGQALIRETNSLSEVSQAVRAHSVVVFDLDNTLIEAAQSLGSDQWFDSVATTQGVDTAVSLWAQIQPRTRVNTVESQTAAIVRDLQAQGTVVLGLTARPLEVAQITNNQLHSVGIDLTLTAPVAPGLTLPGEAGTVIYQNGVLFAGKNQKGKTLVQFFNALKLRPQHVIFADDKAKHTKTVDAALNQLGVENLEFRYGAADPKVEAFDPQIAALQLKYFFGILDDESAKRLLEH